MQLKKLPLGLAGLFFLLVFIYAFQVDSGTVTAEKDIEMDSSLARVYLIQADSLYFEEEIEKATALLEKVNAYYLENKSWDNLVFCLAEQAKVADYQTVEIRKEFIEEAIRIAKLHLSPDHEYLGLAYRQKGEYFINAGMNDSSIVYLNLALANLLPAENWEDISMCKLFLAINHYFKEEYQLMRQQLEEARLLIAEKEIPIDVQIQILDWSGVYAQVVGDYESGIQFTKQALALNLDAFDSVIGDSIDLFGQYYNLGNLYYFKGDFQRSLDYYEIGRNIYLSQGYEDPDLVLAYHNIGHINSILRNDEAAIANLKESLRIGDKLGNPYVEDQVNNYNRLSWLYLEREESDSAKKYLNLALELNINFGKSTSYGQLGLFQKRQGEIDRAISSLNKAIEISPDNSYGKKALWLIYLGDCYKIQNDFSVALQYYQSSIATACPGFSDTLNYYSNPKSDAYAIRPVYFLKALHAKAIALAEYNEDPKALGASMETYNITIELIKKLNSDNVLEASQLSWSKKFKQIYGEAAVVADRLYERENNPAYLDSAFSFMEQSKSSILLDALKSSAGKILGGVPDSLVQKEKDLAITIAFYEKAISEDPDEDQKIEFQGKLSEQKLILAQLKEQIQEDYPNYHQLKFAKTDISISTIQEFLPDEETIFIEYFINDHAALAFVISKNEFELIQLPETELIRAATLNFRSLLNSQKSNELNEQEEIEQYNAAAFNLYELILKDALADKGSANKLIIVADGILNNIPFEALTATATALKEPTTDFGQLDYLLNHFEFRYAYSAGLMIKNQEHQAALHTNIDCLAMAPVYQADESIVVRGNADQLRADFGQLAGTGKEIQAIANYFSGEFDLSESATEAAFKAKASNFGILHLAMHGEADFENPSFGNLIFSNTKSDSIEDNKLYHYEIANMDLNAQLVVLSACETGLGKYEEGEGVFSLGRSFMYAGVPSVVMSLWKVSDQSTSQLMPFFYEELAAGKKKSTALHEAKKTYLSEVDSEFRHPNYWAGFILIGDHTEIHGSSAASNWIWILGIGLFIGLALIWGIKKLLQQQEARL